MAAYSPALLRDRSIARRACPAVHDVESPPGPRCGANVTALPYGAPGGCARMHASRQSERSGLPPRTVQHVQRDVPHLELALLDVGAQQALRFLAAAAGHGT